MTFTGEKNFTPAEVACKCGCGMLPEADFMRRVQMARDLFGRPMPVSSGARCPAHNAKESKTGLTGPHTTKRAIDVQVSGPDAFYLIRVAMKCGFTGIGVSQRGPHGTRFVHLDDLPDAPGQPRPTVWSY